MLQKEYLAKGPTRAGKLKLLSCCTSCASLIFLAHLCLINLYRRPLSKGGNRSPAQCHEDGSNQEQILMLSGQRFLGVVTSNEAHQECLPSVLLTLATDAVPAHLTTNDSAARNDEHIYSSVCLFWDIQMLSGTG